MYDAIINFYSGAGQDGSPTIHDVLNANYDWLEANHNWCQRAYPNFEHSAVVPDAPVLSESTLKWLQDPEHEKEIQRDILMLVFKLIKHYSELSLDRIPHNNRRVTRMLKFLKLMGMADIAETCYTVFTDSLAIHVMASGVPTNCDSTVEFWNAAINYEPGDDWVV